ncbi:MAG: 3'-5' exonuclease [Myxococcota bacterium]
MTLFNASIDTELRPFVFLATKKTGPDPAVHEIIEFAAIRVDPRMLAVESQQTFKIQPSSLEQADPAALDDAGYDEEAWKDALTYDQAITRILPILDGATLAGHQVALDREFLDQMWQRHGKSPQVSRHLFDTVTLAWPLIVDGTVKAMSLDAIAQALEVEREADMPKAMADARASLEIARHLLTPDEEPASEHVDICDLAAHLSQAFTEWVADRAQA